MKEILLKYVPKKIYYIGLCSFILFYSLIEKTEGVFLEVNHFIYEYGLMTPWIRIHSTKSQGIKSLVHMLKHSDKGIEWIPQAIFIDAAIIYLVMAVFDYIASCKKQKK
ncbi:MAG: hypothetical protein IKL51_11205 [Lachnospiraceae bacterium]|mgnify:CR=1 FL=1|nr:hypothetical protein [Lachnospiraceae bacterium]